MTLFKFNTQSTFGSLDDLINYVISLKNVDFSHFNEFNLELNFDIVNHDD